MTILLATKPKTSERGVRSIAVVQVLMVCWLQLVLTTKGNLSERNNCIIDV